MKHTRLATVTLISCSSAFTSIPGSFTPQTQEHGLGGKRQPRRVFSNRNVLHVTTTKNHLLSDPATSGKVLANKSEFNSSLPLDIVELNTTEQLYDAQYKVAADIMKDPGILRDDMSPSLSERARGIIEKVSEGIGKVDEDRIAIPEYASGEVDRLFSNIRYDKPKEGGLTKAVHAAGSTVGAAALIAGTTVGAGVLGLPAATAPAGFIPSVGGMCLAWAYMVASGLLIAELSLNRIGETGRPGSGLLDLYKSVLGGTGSAVGSAAYFFLHYTMMVAYLAQGGNNLQSFAASMGIDALNFHGSGQILFAALAGLFVYMAKSDIVENVNNTLVLALGAVFVGIMGIGFQSADFHALVAPANQHPEMVVRAFPILLLALVYQNVVPTVVTQLEGDKKKITTAIIAGTAAPLLMFIAWNAIILGNVFGAPLDVLTYITSGNLDPIALLQQNGGVGGEMLSALVGSFSQLALTTSLIGFVYGLIDALTDVFSIPIKGPIFEKNKPLLYAGVFVPPLLLSLANPDIFYQALDYGGAFGVSTLFLVLPPLMVWKARYGEEKKPVATLPMVPGGKVVLSSLWKVAGTLIVEQTAEKVGLIDWIQQTYFPGSDVISEVGLDMSLGIATQIL